MWKRFTVAALSAALLVPAAPALAAEKPCKNKVIQAIDAAGWDGRDRRIAYAVSWRESNHNPRAVGAGSYGLFQLQASVWSGASWWNWDTVLTLKGNARMAHKLWKRSRWQPWGINRSGTGMDLSSYGGWSSWQHQNWIWAPYTTGVRLYENLPKECRK